MKGPSRWGLPRRRLALLLMPFVVMAGCGSGSHHPAASRTTPRIRPAAGVSKPAVTASKPLRAIVGGPSNSRPIQPGFLGLSLEYRALEPYAGTDPAAINPVFEQLIRNLTPGQAPNIRIGGDTSDWTWWPIAGMATPGGIRFALDDRWLALTRALANDLGAKLILGINLEADNAKLAAVEGAHLLSGIGRNRIQALEPGNEPELYGALTFYVKNGQKFTGRPHGYSFNDYMGDFSRISAGLSGLPLAGPAIGGPGWKPYTGQFINGEPRLRVLTMHGYPLLQCFKTPASPVYPTVAHLLSARSTTGLADGVAPYAALAHAHHVPLRIDEMNSLSCGHEHAVSDAFVSALWSLDALFEMARVGVDGVNFHSFPSASSEIFSFSQTSSGWSGKVNPDYYGLLAFAQAAPPRSKLLRVSGGGEPIKTWATLAPDGKTRVVLINEASSASRTVELRIKGITAAGSLERLLSSGMHAHSGITLGGRSFGTATTTGLLGQPRLTQIVARRGVYSVQMPAASAAILTLP